MMQFIVLGQIPGTNISLSFTAVMLLMLVAAVAVLYLHESVLKLERQERAEIDKISI